MASNPRRRPRLVRAITIVLIVKFLSLGVIWKIWFSEPESRHLDRERVGATIYSSPVAVQEGNEARARP